MTRHIVIGLMLGIAVVLLIYVMGVTGRRAVAQTTRPNGAAPVTPPVKTNALAHTVNDLNGKPFNLADLKGKVVVVVNTASKCGFTGQYEGLEAMYDKYKEQGLVVVGFPCNDFGGQEPGSSEEIKAFCETKFHVSFPMMEKVEVKGDGKSPVYKALTEGTGEFAGAIKWNFEKFVIARDGETILARFGSRVKPGDEKFVEVVEAGLK